MQDKDEEQPFLGGDKKKDNDLEFRVSGRGMLVWGCVYRVDKGMVIDGN